MPLLRHIDGLGTARFVTFSCYRRLPLLDDDGIKQALIHTLDIYRRRNKFHLFGYVIMPEHVHLVLLPSRGVALGPLLGTMKSHVAKRVMRGHSKGQRHVLWQARCYDHNCRTVETTLEKINYCHMNPVKRGLVSDPAAWIWSSYRNYHDLPDLRLEVDLMSV